MNARVGQKSIEWPADGQNMYSSEQLPHIEVRPRPCPYTYHITYILDIRIRQGDHGNIPVLGNTRSSYTVNYSKTFRGGILVSDF